MGELDDKGFLIVLIVFLIFLAYFIGYNNGEKTGYQRGLEDAKDMQLERVIDIVKDCKASFLVVQQKDAEYLNEEGSPNG